MAPVWECTQADLDQRPDDPGRQLSSGVSDDVTGPIAYAHLNRKQGICW